MADMLHEISIHAPARSVYDALTTAAGLCAWWTADSTAEPAEGTEAVFGFGARSTVFRMRVATLQPGARVVWHCEGDVDEWRGTTLTWALAEVDGAITVRFRHADWRATDGMYAVCNTTWGTLLYRLRDYCEGRAPGPLFTGTA